MSQPPLSTNDDRGLRYILRQPDANAFPRPRGLLIHLAMDCFTTLDETPYHLVSTPALAAGFAVGSFDLPCHGQDAVAGIPNNLQAIAQAIRAGDDPFARIRKAGSALIDRALAHLPAGAPIVIAGVSRGGLAALHVMAHDRRISAAALLAPVTHLPALTEFADLADHPLVRAASADALVPLVADRPIHIAINQIDPRVSTERCVAFAERVRALGGHVDLNLSPGDNHSLPDRMYQWGGACLVSDMERTA